MTDPLRLSVIMPSYNHVKYIGAAIDSVLADRDGGTELIVMDGGSRDGTVDVLRAYGNRLRFVSAPDRGQGDAINRGFQQARGDILCWLNSDDMFAPGAIPRVVRALRENPGVAFVYGRGWDIDETGQIIGEAGVLPYDLWRLIHQRNFIQQPSCFFRRSLLETVGPVDESLHYVMDWELWIRFGGHRGLYVDDFWSFNRVHRDNKTQSGQLRRWREIRAMVRRYTRMRWPPVVRLYLLEALIQLARRRGGLAPLERLLDRLFTRGMARDLSGRYHDGGLRRRFRFSVGNPRGRRPIALTLCPLSRYDRSRRDAPAVPVAWRTSAGGRGVLALLETGVPQRFEIPPGETDRPFLHVSCRADFPGVALDAGGGLPARRIIGFLDDLEA